MTELSVIKRPGGVLTPATENDAEIIAKWRTGDVIKLTASRRRNPAWHRKYFALLNLGYSYFEPQMEYKGEPVLKNFDRFREDIAILSGWYELVPTVTGEVRAKAKSISFATMDEDQFAELYSKTIDILLQRVLVGWTHSEVEQTLAAQDILSFA